jgi:hypothetical protein
MRPTGRLLELKRHGIDGMPPCRPARIAAVVGMAVQDDLTLKRSMVSASREQPRKE